MGITLSKKQYASIINSNARKNIWCGSIRSGKTIASLIRWVAELNPKLFPAINKGRKILTGVSTKTLERNIISKLFDIFGRVADGGRVEYNAGRQLLYIDGVEIDCIGGSTEHAKARLRGADVSTVYCDEITMLNHTFFQELLGRLSIDESCEKHPFNYSKLFGTTNPDNPAHWFYKEHISKIGNGSDPAGKEYRLFLFNLADNPTLTPRTIAAYAKEFSGVWRDQLIYGLWRGGQDQIFDMFDPKIHVKTVDEMKHMLYPHLTDERAERAWNGRYRFAGIDTGTTNPTACTVISGNRSLSQPLPLYIEKEWYYDKAQNYGKSMSDAEQAKAIRHFLWNYQPKKITEVYVDPSSASFKVASKKLGMGLINAQNAVLPGIKLIGSLLSTEALFINPECEHVIDDFYQMRWDESKALQGTEAPIKQHDHAFDSVRYQLWTKYGHTNILNYTNIRFEWKDGDLLAKAA